LGEIKSAGCRLQKVTNVIHPRMATEKKLMIEIGQRLTRGEVFMICIIGEAGFSDADL
jgi:hypothetical protein